MATKNNSRKKVTKKQEQKESKKESSILKYVLIVVIVATLAVLIIFALREPKEEEKKDIPLSSIYNGYVFNKTRINTWVTTVRTHKGDLPIDFYYHPQEVEHYTYNINISRDMANMVLRQGNFLIGFDTAYNETGLAAIAGAEISRITGKIFDLKAKSGFISALEDPAIPVVNCSMANHMNMVLEFRASDESKMVYNNNYCITIYAQNPEDLVKLSDFLTYKLLGVIPRITGTNQTANSPALINSSN
jgi:hypothetical protein